MSPAGAGIQAFRRHTNKPACYILLAILTVAACILLIPGGQPTAHAAPVNHVQAAWRQFAADCEAGPSPGQGNAQSACECWIANLEAEAIGPGYAVDVLNAAQVGGGAAYTVPENIGNVAVSNAMQGCGLYPQTA